MTPEEPTPVFPGLDVERSQPEPAASAMECVIVGIDGSVESHAALRWALRYAGRTGSPVEAVAAWQFPPPWLGAADAMTVSAEDVETAACRSLEEAAASANVHLDRGVQLIAVRGDPVDVLLDRARTSGLIVLGNKGRGAITATVLGSVAQRCVRHANCPVVLVPPN